MPRVTGEKFRLRTKMLIHSRQFAFSLNPLLARGYVCSLSDIISAISMPIIFFIDVAAKLRLWHFCRSTLGQNAAKYVRLKEINKCE